MLSHACRNPSRRRTLFGAEGFWIAVASGALCVVALIAYMAFVEWNRRSIERLAQQTTESVARAVDQSIQNSADRVRLALDVVVSHLQASHGKRSGEVARSAIDAELAGIQRMLGAGAMVSVSDASGRVIFGQGSAPDTDYGWASTPLFAKLESSAARGTIVSDPMFFSAQSGWRIAFVKPYFKPDGAFGGIAAISVPVADFARLLSAARLGANGIALLRDSRSRMIARYPVSTNPNEQIGKAQFSPQLHRAIESGRMVVNFHAIHTGDGVERVEVYRRLTAVPFYLVVGTAERDYLAPWWRMVSLAGIGVLLFCATELALAALLWRTVRQNRERRQQTEALLRSATDGLFVVDENNRIVQTSDSFCEMLDYQREALVGMSLPAIEEPGSTVVSIVDSDAGAKQTFSSVYRDRQQRRHHIEGVSVAYRAGRRDWRFIAARDVTVRNEREEQLRVAAVTFEAQQGLLVGDSKGIVLRVNRAFTELSGYSATDVIGKSMLVLNNEESLLATWDAVRDAVRHEGHWEGEFVIRVRRGQPLHVWMDMSAVRDDQGSTTHYVCALSKITESKLAEQRLIELAYLDELTKLPNRRLLRDRAEHALQLSKRSAEYGALLMLDLDFFKRVNDTSGHNAGDELLKLVAQRVTSALNGSDSAARLGGDEFVVLLEGLGKSEQSALFGAQHSAQRLMAVIGAPVAIGDFEHYPSCSLGITLFRGDAVDVDTLFKQADLALYAAKAAGRHAIRFYAPAMQQLVDREAHITTGLRQALERQELQIYYQAQVRLGGAVIGAEALLRWRQSDGRFISPADFIPLAEESGLILPIGEWVIRTVCEQLERWAQDPVLGALMVAVNVSASQVQDPDFAARLRGILRETGAPQRRLKLEITERAMVANLANVLKNMESLRELGISFSIDDFGTGYSSLSYLKKLPVDQLKIDKSFVDDIESSNDSRAVVRAIISLASSLGMSTIAEGVESDRQKDLLIELGNQDFQGYLFGRPMPVDEFVNSIKRGKKDSQKSGLLA